MQNLWVIGLIGMAASSVCAADLAVSARRLPVAREVDVLVVGGSTGAVAAATEARAAGATVLLVAPRHYLGEDLCDTLRLWIDADTPLDDPLLKAMFGGARAAGRGSPRAATPMRIKRALDAALLEADVEFLFGCYPSAVLTDTRRSKATGVILANRAGRQLVKARAIIDATPHAAVVRLCDRMREARPGPRTFRRVVVGGEAVDQGGRKPRELPFTIDNKKNKPLKVYEYELDLPLDEGETASWMAAEQTARDRTHHPAAEDASGRLFCVPQERIVAAKSVDGPWPGAAKADLDAFRLAAFANVHVAGPSADVSREAAAALMDPAQRAAIGRRVGRRAGDAAQKTPRPSEFVPARPAPSDAEPIELRELLGGLRGAETHDTQRVPAALLADLGAVDVVVVGGGTSGAPAAIAAARRGAKVLVIEYQYDLGGTGTVGLIGRYCHGFRGGFTAEVDKACGRRQWDVNAKAEWWRRQIRKAGGHIWIGCLGAGALVDAQKRVRGVAVATPQGFGAVRAKVVIDATGGADIAAAAGADCIYTGAEFLAVQGAGLPPRELGADYTNTDFAFADETDMLDVWRLFVHVRRRYRRHYDHAPLIDTRERRRIVGDVVLNLPEILAGRTWADTICRGRTNFDTHGYTVEPLLFLSPPDRRQLDAWMPYRMLLPRGLDGILVTGLGAAAHRDAVPLVRMQADLQNQGYAAGCAAAMAAAKDLPIRDIDVRALQEHLVEIGQVPDSVLSHTDGLRVAQRDVAEAVARLGEDVHRAAIVLTHPKQALPLLAKAMAAAEGEAKVLYAQALATLGDRRGLDVLIAAIDARDRWDNGWNFRGLGQFGRSVSPLDAIIIAAGFAGHPKALPAICRKARRLTPKHAFSHHRAVAVALERIGDPSAAETLSKLLRKKHMTGHNITGPEVSKDRSPSLREIILARALYRLGDPEGEGEEILRAYTRDYRGHFARHAAAVLNAGNEN
jgi:hypothetical protein